MIFYQANKKSIFGRLALSTSHEKTDIRQLFNKILAEIFPGGVEDDEELRKASTSAFECNGQMNHIITLYSQADVLGWIKDDGFNLTVALRISYDGCVVIVEAIKP